MYLLWKFRNDSRGIGSTSHCNNSKGTKGNNRGNICKSKDCLVQFLPKPRSKSHKKKVQKTKPKIKIPYLLELEPLLELGPMTPNARATA